MTGEFVYLSERKLEQLCRTKDVKFPSRDHPPTETDVSASVSARVPLFADAAIEFNRKNQAGGSIDRQSGLRLALKEAVDRLESCGLAELDDPHVRLHRAGWFRFHRNLKFGVGSADHDYSVRALVLIDEYPVDYSETRVGLMMHGSIIHVLPPYLPDNANELEGARSGSRTGALFEWARDISESVEVSASGADFPPTPSGSDEDAADMYRLLSTKDWFGTRQLTNPAPCEGVAWVTNIAVDNDTTIVMGTPLYVRMAPFPEATGNAAVKPKRRFWQRFRTRRN